MRTQMNSPRTGEARQQVVAADVHSTVALVAQVAASARGNGLTDDDIRVCVAESDTRFREAARRYLHAAVLAGTAHPSPTVRSDRSTLRHLPPGLRAAVGEHIALLTARRSSPDRASLCELRGAVMAIRSHLQSEFPALFEGLTAPEDRLAQLRTAGSAANAVKEELSMTPPNATDLARAALADGDRALSGNDHGTAPDAAAKRHSGAARVDDSASAERLALAERHYLNAASLHYTGSPATPHESAVETMSRLPAPVRDALHAARVDFQRETAVLEQRGDHAAVLARTEAYVVRLRDELADREPQVFAHRELPADTSPTR